MALTAGFPRVPGDRDAWRRTALVALVVLVATGSVVALFRTTGSSHKVDAAGDAAASRSTEAGYALDTASKAAPSAASSAPVVGPSIVRTAELRVRIRGSILDASDRATAVATDLGGFVTTSSTSSLARGQGSADLTLRIPAARFDEARRRLGRLGTLESADVHGNDVGGQLVDLDARLRTLRAEEGALDVLLGKAGDIGQILQVRDRLTAVRTEIEQLAGQQVALRDQVALATVQVSLHQSGAPSHPTEERRTGLAASARTAWHAAEAVGMLITLGALVPFVVLALLAWPVVGRIRRGQPRNIPPATT